MEARLAAFERSLDPSRPQEAGGEVLGYGEVSVVLGIADWPQRVLKRTSGFRKREDAEAYRDAVLAYASELRTRGVDVIETEALVIDRIGRGPVLYLIQPRVLVERLGQVILHTATSDQLEIFLHEVLDRVSCVLASNNGSTYQVALDAQLSNWAMNKRGELTYIDIGQPLIRREGKLVLDPAVLRQPYPAPVRAYMRTRRLVERYMLRYFDFRETICDLLGNVIKEGASDSLEKMIEHCQNWHGEAAVYVDDFSPQFIYDCYRRDVATWERAARMRRLAQSVSRLIGRRYDYVVPGNIKRW